MVIDFEFNPIEEDERELIPKFIHYILFNIRKDIMNELDPERCQLYEEELLNASWIVWTDKPKHLNVYRMVYYILQKLTCVQDKKGNYTIRFKHQVFPGTRNFVDAFIRLLDKGNEVCPPMYVFTRVFGQYKANMDTYWREYVFANTFELPKSKIIS